MTCMTSVGFGNVSPETDNEKMFTIIMMIIGGRLKSVARWELKRVANLADLATNSDLILAASSPVCYHFWSCNNHNTANDVCDREVS